MFKTFYPDEYVASTYVLDFEKMYREAVVDWYLTLTIRWFRMEHRQMREQSVFLTGCAASGLIHA